MEQRDSHCPYLHPSEPTAKGTGLAQSAGKEDPVELDSSVGLRGRPAGVGRWEAAQVKDHCGPRAPAPRSNAPRWGVWLGRHVCYTQTQTSYGGLSADRTRASSTRAHARLTAPPPGAGGKPGPSDLSAMHAACREWQKSYHRDNWLVAAKRPQRRRFLILRCRLFLAWRGSTRQVLDCSPTDRERELGLDRRETG